MKWFNNLRISAKLLTGFASVLLITGVIGYVGISNVKKIDAADTALYAAKQRGRNCVVEATGLVIAPGEGRPKAA